MGKWIHKYASKKKGKKVALEILWRWEFSIVSIRCRQRVCSANDKATSPGRALYDLDQTCTEPPHQKCVSLSLFCFAHDQHRRRRPMTSRNIPIKKTGPAQHNAEPAPAVRRLDRQAYLNNTEAFCTVMEMPMAIGMPTASQPKAT
ncbi:MAG TPA: hypothetical protein VN089_00575, partial [Duganella sp.]|nr:hypothetical protein [Duganella sp.]